MKFQKGQSGNPGGRPKINPEERTQWEILAKKGRDKLNAILDKEDVADNVVAKITEIAANRAWGTPVQAVELSGGDGEPVGFKFVDPPAASTK